MNKTLKKLNKLPITPPPPGTWRPILIPYIIPIDSHEFLFTFRCLIVVVKLIMTPLFFLIRPDFLLTLFILIFFWIFCSFLTLKSFQLI